MLVVTRRIGESLVIETASGEQIELTVLDAQGSRVRLSATTNEGIKVYREEEIAASQYVM